MWKGAERALALVVRLATLVAPLAFGALMLRSGLSAGDGSRASVAPVRSPAVLREPPRRRLELAPDEALAELFERGGLGVREASGLADMAGPYLVKGRPGPGASATFRGWPNEPPERVDLKIDPDRTLVFGLSGASWDLRVETVPVTLDTVVVAGDIASTLWSARLGGDGPRLSLPEKAALPGHLADVFAWQVDFYRDVRPGDRFRLALERRVRPDGTIRGATPVAAEWRGAAGAFEAYRFAPSDEAGSFYYDAEGVALRGPFLRAPLDLARVTSRFSADRSHPVLGGRRAHRGIDYGAPSGTPVRATGDGVVRRAGWAGDYGLLVELEHAGGIRTRYAHLSGVAHGIVPGVGVGQGEPLGAVGSSGLVSGPHLHYEFLLRGRAVDPASVDLPVERPLPEADVARFARHRHSAAALLRGVRGSRVPADGPSG